MVTVPQPCRAACVLCGEGGVSTPADHFPCIRGLAWHPDAPLGQG